LAGRLQNLTDSRQEGDAFNPDMTDALYFALSYPRSLGRRVDLTVDMRHTISSGTYANSTNPFGGDWSMTTSVLGPGIRYTFSERRIRPYAQLNLFLAGTGGDQPTGYSESDGVGVGASAGIDFGLSRGISVPVEVNYIPIDFVSGYGANLGITFNW
jgi:hypothetical protein